LKRIEKKITDIWGRGSVIWSWAPADRKPYKPLTVQQRFSRAITKAQNQFFKNVQEIRTQNYLFEETFIKEESEKLQMRQQVLKQRYGLDDSGTK
jgi:DNA-binding helix-hairpin-helix protein with protein kinase domain